MHTKKPPGELFLQCLQPKRSAITVHVCLLWDNNNNWRTQRILLHLER